MKCACPLGQAQRLVADGIVAPLQSPRPLDRVLSVFITIFDREQRRWQRKRP